MGKKTREVIENGWRIEVKLTERKVTQLTDSYDGPTGVPYDETVDHMDLSVTADNKDAAILKAIRHLTGELGSVDDLAE